MPWSQLPESFLGADLLLSNFRCFCMHWNSSCYRISSIFYRTGINELCFTHNGNCFKTVLSFQTNIIPVKVLKTFFVILCDGRLKDKLSYLFREFADGEGNFIRLTRLQEMLKVSKQNNQLYIFLQTRLDWSLANIVSSTFVSRRNN